MAGLLIAGMLAFGIYFSVAQAPQTGARGFAVTIPTDSRTATAEAAESGAVWAISFVRARPGQRERLERFLKSNWLALDQQAFQQKKIKAYRMLRADADPKESSWDYAVIIEYADRQAMADFVPVYLALARERPHVRVDGLDFADLGEVVQQKVVEPLGNGIEVPGE